MMKRIAAVAAVSLVALQLMAGTSFAAGKALGKNKGAGTPATAQCSLIAGTGVISGGSGNDAFVWTDGKYLYCGDTWTGTDPDTYGDDDAPLLSEVNTVLVQGDNVIFYLGAADSTGTTVDVLGNPKSANFGGLRVTVDTAGTLYFDATFLDTAYFGTSVKVSNTAFSGMGLVGTIYYADALEFDGGDGADSFDASAVAADVTADGNGGADTLKSGSGDDTLTGGLGSDKLFGASGSDTLDISADGNDQGWGGAGDDAITAGGDPTKYVDTVAPGDGYDFIDGSDLAVLYYGDSTSAVDTTYAASDGEIDTENDFDFFSGITVYSFVGSAKADLILMDGWTDSADGGAGNDIIKGGNTDDTIKGGAGNDTLRGRGGKDIVRGNAGNDVLYGGAGDDSLFGGPDSDQTWGDGGKDLCGGEVKDSCELVLA